MFEDLRNIVAAIRSGNWKAAAKIILKWAGEFLDNPPKAGEEVVLPILASDSDEDLAKYLEVIAGDGKIKSQFAAGGIGVLMSVLLPMLLKWLSKKFAQPA